MKQFMHAPTGKPYICEADGTYYHPETPRLVINELQRLRNAGTRVRLFYGDVKTGVAWAEENDVCGYLFRTMGPLKAVGLLASRRSSGGGLILEHCIVAIAIGPGQFTYKHPSFSVGTWEPCAPETAGYLEAVKHNGTLHAQFKKPGSAARYIAFMRGERMAA